MQVLTSIVLPFAAATALLAPHTRAQGFELHLGQKLGHGAILLSYATGLPYHARPPVACPPTRVWVPGHYETRCEQVFVPGALQRIWVPPAYAWRYDRCGRAYQVCTRPGFWRDVCTPGRYETREVQVWVDGSWR